MVGFEGLFLATSNADVRPPTGETPLSLSLPHSFATAPMHCYYYVNETAAADTALTKGCCYMLCLLHTLRRGRCPFSLSFSPKADAGIDKQRKLTGALSSVGQMREKLKMVPPPFDGGEKQQHMY